MTTVNPTYLLIRSPAQPVSVRCFAVPMGRDITNSQVTAEQTAVIIAREVGRLLQLALAAAQIPGVTPATGSVYAQAAPSAAANATAVRSELATELARIDASVSSRLATAGYTAPPSATTNAAAVRTELSTELARVDVATSTRLASSGYTAPDNTPAPTAAANAAAVRSELATELARIDAPVSSRLATADYTAPDNAAVAAIKTKTDNLPAAPASQDDIPSAAENAAVAGQRIVERGLTADAIQRIQLAALVGKTAGIGSVSETYFAQDGTTPRVVAGFDQDNNRTSVTLDGDA